MIFSIKQHLPRWIIFGNIPLYVSQSPQGKQMTKLSRYFQITREKIKIWNTLGSLLFFFFTSPGFDPNQICRPIHHSVLPTFQLTHARSWGLTLTSYCVQLKRVKRRFSWYVFTYSNGLSSCGSMDSRMPYPEHH